MKSSYTEKNEKEKKSPQALQKSPTRRYGVVTKNMAVFVGLLKFPLNLNTTQVQRALKEVTQSPEVSFFCPSFIHS